MKTIKIKFVDFFKDFNPYKNDFVDILSKRYNIIFSESPDYIIYSCFGYDHLKYNCIRIFFTGECITPDFNECDYAIGFDRLQFADRYIRIPLYMLFQYKKEYLSLIDRRTFTSADLSQKKGFCSFVYSNCFAQDKRTGIFEKLSEYKRVDSGGRYKNNIGGAVADKNAFQSKHKFSIAFENTSYVGYTTEKIVEAFFADTIPIYYGNPQIALDFNEKAFINCHNYNSLEEVVKRVKEIDQDEELYLQIINEPPIIKKPNALALENFLYNIFDQNIEFAFRRPFSQPAKSMEQMKLRHKFFETKIYKNLNKAHNMLIRLKRKTILTSKRKNVNFLDKPQD